MIHDFNIVFDTDNELWQRVLEIFNNNEKYPKKIVSGRNLHHKFPRSFSKKLGEAVDNDKDNLISLSLSDHFLVHYYYYKLARTGFKQPMAMAFSLMAKKQLKYISPETAESMAKDYEEARKFGPMSEETKKKISEHTKGKKLSKDIKDKIRNTMKGKPHPHKGTPRPKSEDIRKRISNTLKGKPQPPNNITALIELSKEPRSEFGRKYTEHYKILPGTNRKLYKKEIRYYNKHGKCSWEEEQIVH